MCIDLRGATRRSARPTEDSAVERKQFEALLNIFQQKAERSGENPTFIKSTGDGLMSFWILPKANRYRLERLKNIFNLAVMLNKVLAKKLADTTHRQLLPGIGLAHGWTSRMKTSLITDYFGFTANLASKLQDRARPNGGLVVAGDYVHELQNAYPNDKLISRSGLKEWTISPDSSLAAYGIGSCFSSGAWPTEWTCLAWSGFASGSSDGGPAGLNTKGLTVLAHEGIQGKLDTLCMWPGCVDKNDGDYFELIIDDFDALEMMFAQNHVHLALRDPEESESPVLQRIVPDLIDHSLPAFTFIPVRCGVNALLWNKPLSLSRIQKYHDIYLMLRKGNLKPSDIGLYDNIGASLPILLSMITGIRLKDIYSHDWAEPAQPTRQSIIQAVCDQLRTVTAECKFKLYPTAVGLARALQRKRVVMTLGGGRWLISPEVDGLGEQITFGMPRIDGGLLWVEGAAISTAGQRNPKKLKSEVFEFLGTYVLSDEYQLSLGSRKPYSSSPVTTSAVEAVNGRNGQTATGLETRLIYDNLHALGDLTRRRCPSRLSEWLFAWNYIRSFCCEKE